MGSEGLSDYRYPIMHGALDSFLDSDGATLCIFMIYRGFEYTYDGGSVSAIYE